MAEKRMKVVNPNNLRPVRSRVKYDAVRLMAHNAIKNSEKTRKDPELTHMSNGMLTFMLKGEILARRAEKIRKRQLWLLSKLAKNI